MKVEINIEWLLEKKNMKLSDLEKKVSLSYQQLWNIKEWRTTKVSFDTIWELLKGFKCKPNDLFKLTGTSKDKLLALDTFLSNPSSAACVSWQVVE